MNSIISRLLIIFIIYLTRVESWYMQNNQRDNLLKQSNITIEKFDITQTKNGRFHVTDLENFRDILTYVYQIFQRTPKKFRSHLYKDKMQKEVPAHQLFPCNVTNGRSNKVPDSVNRLRPGDIDVIAAFGDSMSAGMGSFTKNIFDILIEYRGVAFSGGGFGDWRKYLTIPNILKEFNPNLYGFSTTINALSTDQSSHLNLAELALMSRDLVYQANVLIDRLKRDPNVDMKNHWKLLTIFVGANDICSDFCHFDDIDQWLKLHELDLRNTLRLLKANVPRLIVNLVLPPNMQRILRQLPEVPPLCQIILRVICNCIFSDRYNDTYSKWTNRNIKRWQALDKSLAELPEFQADDFVVIYQPIMSETYLPNKPGTNKRNMNLFAVDCMHCSQLGHAIIANGVWNNLLQKYGEKQLNLDVLPFENFECPTVTRPYIATYNNSRNSSY